MSMQSEGKTSRMEVDDDPQKLASQYKAFRQGHNLFGVGMRLANT